MLPILQSELSIRGESIQSIYGSFLQKKFLVNRRYQRKLVWTIDEKQSFIDSILNGYPIPLILLADVIQSDSKKFEIIDGMQRLNAIFSFIEQEFDINGKYFDLDTMADTKLLKDNKELIQKEPLLNREECAAIAKYQIPLSIFQDKDSEHIDDVFKRLNSGGKHLSKQELRQAGATSKFASIVRILSSRIRGDSSSQDILDLKSMSKISINNKKLDYGILIDNIFWIKNAIIGKDDLRLSKDEEIIADLVAWVTLSGSRSSSDVLDQLYGFTNKSQSLKNNIDIEIQKRNENVIIESIQYVFDIICNLISESGKTFNSLLFSDGSQAKISRYFQIVFITLYRLLIDEDKEITNKNEILKLLNDSGNKIISLSEGGGNWSETEKRTQSDALYGVISKCFSFKNESDLSKPRWSVTALENILTQSSTESVLCDFKLGFHSLHTKEKDDFNINCLSKVIKTLTAMANSRPGSIGYCIIGIADNKKDAEKFKKLYGSDYIRFNSFYITGLDNEANKYHSDLDQYFTRIVQYIREQNISKRDKDYILTNIEPVSYHNKYIIILKLKSDKSPSIYDGQYYVRHGSNNEEVSAEHYGDLFSKFIKL